MILEEIIEFLSNIPPFQFLDRVTLTSISSNISTEVFPKGTVILQQNGPPNKDLMIIKKGRVKVFLKSDNETIETIQNYKSQGDLFGLLSLFNDDTSKVNVVAETDTICYSISKGTILEYLDSHPAFTEFFLKSFSSKLIDKTSKDSQEMQGKSLLYSRDDKLLFTTHIGELATKEVTTADQNISIKKAAEIMSQNQISSLVLLDEDDIPAGIVTDRDLRDKVVSKERNATDPVMGIMSISLIKVDAKSYCLEALLKMIHYNIHHLLVIDNGKLKGIITNHDLMMLQGTAPLSIAREIEDQYTIEGLINMSKKIGDIIGMLIKEGVKASNITRIITEVNDKLLQKILVISERNIGRSPVKYCWFVFGSEGRKEQTFKTEQENAIIYEDPLTSDAEDKAREYFSRFSLYVKDALIRCGYPAFPANYVTNSTLWCQPLKVWKKYFNGWITEPTSEAVLNSFIFFDFRPISGDHTLAESLRDYLTSTIDEHQPFLVNIANTLIKNRPPIGFFNQFVVEKSGEHKNKLNLKTKGISPIVDVIRFFALEKDVRETSTIERINELKNKHAIVQIFAKELEHAFEFVMLLRIQHQFKQVETGQDYDDYINLQDLNNFEKKTIKEVFRLIAKMHGFLMRDMSVIPERTRI